jgi:hypothetical protein
VDTGAAISAPEGKEVRMSITCMSVGRSGSAQHGHAAASRGRRKDRDTGSGDDAARSESPARRDRLVSAMMQALQGLAQVHAAAEPTPAAPDQAAPSASEAGPASAPGADVTQAAMAFAHELYAALRSDGEGHPGRHLGWTRGYGNLAHRLDALAQTLEASATPATATTAPVDDGTAAVAASTAALAPATSEPAAAPQADTGSPLLGAFQRLSSTLGPAVSVGSPTNSSIAEKLADFLRTVARALVPGSDAESELPAHGSLLDVHA